MVMDYNWKCTEFCYMEQPFIGWRIFEIQSYDNHFHLIYIERSIHIVHSVYIIPISVFPSH